MKDENENREPQADREQVFKLLAGAVEQHLHGQVDEEKVRQIAGEEIAKRQLPVTLEVSLPNGEIRRVEGAHSQFKALLQLAEQELLTTGGC